MYEIEILDLKHLKPKKKDIYQTMLRQGYKYLFTKQDLLDPSNENLLAVCATVEKVPVGLVIGERKTKEELEIKSMFVAEGHHKINLLTRMLKFLEEQFASLHGQYIRAFYPNTPSFAEEWEGVFTKAKWIGRRLAVVECYYGDGSKFHPSWYKKEYELPPDFEIFPWKDLKQEERVAIEKAYERKEIPDEVYPFAAGGVYEPMNSLGLRYHDKVIGWLITRQVDPNTICYYSIYTEYEYHNRGFIIQLLIHALKLQQQSSFNQAIFRVNIIQLPNLKWLRFVRKRLAPYATTYTEYYMAWQILDS